MKSSGQTWLEVVIKNSMQGMQIGMNLKRDQLTRKVNIWRVLWLLRSY